MARWVIADDSRPQRLWLIEALLRAGQEVVGDAGTAAEAIALCRQHNPDFISLDVVMPGMTGDVAARTLIEEGLVGHVVMLTSNTQDAIVEPLRAMGCTVLKKPFTSKEKYLSEIAALLKAHP